MNIIIVYIYFTIADTDSANTKQATIEYTSQGTTSTQNKSPPNTNPQTESAMIVTKAQSQPNNTKENGVSDNAHQAVSSNPLPHQQSCDSNQSVPEDRLAELRSFPYYQLYVHLKQGHDLPAKDACGTSDPYVKFSWKGKPVYKSKTIYKDLNPFWDEAFILTIDDPLQPLELKVGTWILLTIFNA